MPLHPMPHTQWMKAHGYEFKRGKDFERRLQIWADNDGAGMLTRLDS